MPLRVILSNFTQEIIFLCAIIANALNLIHKLTLGFRRNKWIVVNQGVNFAVIARQFERSENNEAI